jgi:hypothetical protein
MRPKGFLSISGIVDGAGNPIPLQKAVDFGWITPGKAVPGWDLSRGEIPLCQNLFLDTGRQFMAYLFGARSPMSDFACQKFGMGTGTQASKVTDTQLQSPIEFSAGVYTKNINSVSFPAPYVARVQFTIGASEGNGYAITELGLFSGSGVLLARVIRTAIPKTSDFSPTLTWRIRF